MNRRFRVALSFAGEVRDFVGRAARVLAERFGEDAIFYDEFLKERKEEDPARSEPGRRVSAPCGEEEEEAADLVVAVLGGDGDVEGKEWAGWPWARVRGLISGSGGSLVMVCRFGGVEAADGFCPEGGFVELDDWTAEEFAALIRGRLDFEEEPDQADEEERWRADSVEDLARMAGALTAKGDLAGAEPLYRRELAARERAPGPEHPDTLACAHDLAGVLGDSGKRAEAEDLYRRTLETRERVLGPDHRDTLSTVNNLAALLDYTGKRAEAEALQQRALEAQERTLGPEHPDTLTSLYNLAAGLSNGGRHAAARPYCRRALEGREKVLGPAHPHTLDALKTLALLGDRAEAEALYRRALENCERLLGPDHLSTLESLHDLAYHHYSGEDEAAAEELHRRALERSERVRGPEHPETVIIRNNLVRLLRRKGDAEEAGRSQDRPPRREGGV